MTVYAPVMLTEYDLLVLTGALHNDAADARRVGAPQDGDTAEQAVTRETLRRHADELDELNRRLHAAKRRTFG